MIKKEVDRIGIFSGSFDPPHKGHLYISKLFIKRLNLRKLIWSVSLKNPLLKKKYLYSYKERVDLSKKISKKINKIIINNFDKKYSYQLLNALKKKYKNKHIFFLIGSDNLRTFHKWKNYIQLFKNSTLVVISRPGYEKNIKQSYFYKKYKHKLLQKFNIKTKITKNAWIYIKDKGVNISSSNIKNRLYNK